MWGFWIGQAAQKLHFQYWGQVIIAWENVRQKIIMQRNPKAVELLLEVETFNKDIWECACGEGHISKVLEAAGHKVLSTDIVDRGYGTGGIDFLNGVYEWDGDIITNPPYKYAKEFVEQAIKSVKDGAKVAMFLKLTFMESKSRKELFTKYPFKTLYVSSSRLQCAKNGKFDSKGTAIAYGWYVWEKGYEGTPSIRWIN